MDTKALIDEVLMDAYLMLYEIRKRQHYFEDGIPLLDQFVCDGLVSGTTDSEVPNPSCGCTECKGRFELS